MALSKDAQLTPEMLLLTLDSATLKVCQAVGRYAIAQWSGMDDGKVVVDRALKALSYSEILAVRALLPCVPYGGGPVVASKIADEAGLTRSVVVNALRKLAIAGLIKAQSMGMKGVYIKILDPQLLDALVAV